MENGLAVAIKVGRSRHKQSASSETFVSNLNSYNYFPKFVGSGSFNSCPCPNNYLGRLRNKKQTNKQTNKQTKTKWCSLSVGVHRELRYKQVKTLLLFQIFCGLFNLNLHRIVIFIGVRLLETEKPHKKITQNRKKNFDQTEKRIHNHQNRKDLHARLVYKQPKFSHIRTVQYELQNSAHFL